MTLSQFAAVIPPATDLLLPIAAVLVGGFLRGFVGFGGALVIVPILSLAFSPKMAVAMHIIMELPGILQLLPAAARHCDRRTVPMMLAVMMAATPLGAFFLVTVDPTIMRAVISVVVLIAVFMLATNWRYRGAIGSGVMASVGAIGGLLQGSTGIGGPPIVAVLLSRPDDIHVSRGNILAMMAGLIVVALPTQWAYGLITPQVLVLGGLAAPLYLLCMWLGSRFYGAGGSRFFRLAALAVLAGTALFTLFASPR